jgi:hypothetical protein
MAGAKRGDGFAETAILIDKSRLGGASCRSSILHFKLFAPHIY